MDAETVVKISDWISDSNLRGMILTSCLGGAVIGFAAGFFLSRPAWEYLRWIREFRRRCGQEDEEQKRIRIENESHKMRGGMLFDGEGNPLCPACQKPLSRVGIYDERLGGICIACGKEVCSALGPQRMVKILKEFYPERYQEFSEQ